MSDISEKFEKFKIEIKEIIDDVVDDKISEKIDEAEIQMPELVSALKKLAMDGDSEKPITRDDLFKALMDVSEWIFI